jgi:hypothetical protein
MVVYGDKEEDHITISFILNKQIDNSIHDFDWLYLIIKINIFLSRMIEIYILGIK